MPLALAGHGLVVGLLMLIHAVSPPPPPRKSASAPSRFTMRTISRARWASNAGLAPSQQRPEAMPRGQVVDVAPGNRQRPVESKYLAETDNRVDKETRAREQTANYGRAAPKNTENSQAFAAKRARQAASEVHAATPARVEQMMGELGARTGPRLMDAFRDSSGERPAQGPAGQDELSSNGTSALDSAPTTAEGGGAPNDDLQDVAAGDGTFLNTREWKYAGFFNRVKQAVSAKWDPNGRLRAKDPAGRNSYGDRVTVVDVTLDSTGRIRDIFVARSSGLDYLDAEAVAAFERAAPFPNPPMSLAQREGLIRFNFSFSVLRDGGLSPMRFFRPPQ